MATPTSSVQKATIRELPTQKFTQKTKENRRSQAQDKPGTLFAFIFMRRAIGSRQSGPLSKAQGRAPDPQAGTGDAINITVPRLKTHSSL